MNNMMIPTLKPNPQRKVKSISKWDYNFLKRRLSIKLSDHQVIK